MNALTKEDMPADSWRYMSPEMARSLGYNVKEDRVARIVARPNPLRTALRWLLLVAAIVALSALAFASDHQCKQTKCWAQISENGVLKNVQFRKGDIICTEDGWIVTDDTLCDETKGAQDPCGWKKLKSKQPSVSGAESIIASRLQWTPGGLGSGPLYRVIAPNGATAWDVRRGGYVQFSKSVLVCSSYYRPVSGWAPVEKVGRVP